MQRCVNILIVSWSAGICGNTHQQQNVSVHRRVPFLKCSQQGGAEGLEEIHIFLSGDGFSAVFNKNEDSIR